MYELKHGTERITNALYSIADDQRSIEKLAAILNYIPDQLAEDIQALRDYIDKSKGD